MKYKAGQMVVCVHTNDPRWRAMIGAVGEVQPVGEIDQLMLRLSSCDYAVDFPSLANMPCPGCGEVHGRHFAMAENELKPLEDPDQAVEEQQEETLPESQNA